MRDELNARNRQSLDKNDFKDQNKSEFSGLRKINIDNEIDVNSPITSPDVAVRDKGLAKDETKSELEEPPIYHDHLLEEVMN